MLTKKELTSFEFWSIQISEIYEKLGTSPIGIAEADAERRQRIFGKNEIAPKKSRNVIFLFLSYFVNPLILLLIVVAAVSYITDNITAAGIISAMVLISISITFYQEYTAKGEIERLRKIIRNTATVVRQGIIREVPLKFLVPGDVVRLSAGDLVPADCRIISCKDFFVNQATLSGESLPVEKNSNAAEKGTQITSLSNVVFFGSSVVSGSADAIIVRTAENTQFGELTQRLAQTGVETAFDRGIREYSNLMVKFVVVLVIAIFIINLVTKNDVISALLFALAVSIGLTPEMLPVIVTANMSQGAKNMAKKGVIVKRLPSIQNLGAMDVLCTDKTGTLTEDRIELVRHVNIDFVEDREVLKYAYLNSYYQTGLRNPLDLAVLSYDKEIGKKYLPGTKKIDEIPFDFVRRRMSVALDEQGNQIMITKGSPESLLGLCKYIKRGGKTRKLKEKEAVRAKRLYDLLSTDGFRVLALATKRISSDKATYLVSDENDLTFEGFLAFLDPPKKTAPASLKELMKRGIEVKILSGDNELVNRKIARIVDLNIKGVITGDEIENTSDDSLLVLVERNTIFARVSPMQKERIIRALQRNRHVVGFLGDGINDSLALKTSDVGVSVDSAVDVAKENADIILLRKSLHVLYEGVDEGRRTFINTMKYLRMGSSSNFGNMLSVVGASSILPFLPMTPVQIILNNFLYDMSQLGVTKDHVDQESLAKPTQWRMDNIKNFVIFVGPISSLFDYLTFGVMWFVFGAQTIEHAALFRAGWFIESLITQTLVVHIIRTDKKPFLESRPSKELMILTAAIVGIGIFIVLTPIHEYFGFEKLPLSFYPILLGLVAAYLLSVQLIKSTLLKMKIIY